MEELNFSRNGLIPAIVQDYGSNQVLMPGYMNKEVLEKTLESPDVWFQPSCNVTQGSNVW